MSVDVFIDARFEPEYGAHPIVLVDAGARGGLRSNWADARRHLRLIGFEPDQREFRKLTAARADDTTTFFDVALHNVRGTVRLHVARDAGLTSIFEPNRVFLDRFPESERFDTVDVREVRTETLDNLRQTHGIADVDFIKADTQGSELFVLQGAEATLASDAIGVEVEVEFTPIYTGQPLFADVDGFLRGLGFICFDLRPCYWKRTAGRDSGGPHGQIVWADALYLKGPAALRTMRAKVGAERRRSKTLKAMSVALLYGYYDYAIDITRDAADVLSAEERGVIERRLLDAGRSAGKLENMPGRRPLASALQRLANLLRPSSKGWSVSDANLGNFR